MGFFPHPFQLVYFTRPSYYSIFLTFCFHHPTSLFNLYVYLPEPQCWSENWHCQITISFSSTTLYMPTTTLFLLVYLKYLRGLELGTKLVFLPIILWLPGSLWNHHIQLGLLWQDPINQCVVLSHYVRFNILQERPCKYVVVCYYFSRVKGHSHRLWIYHKGSPVYNYCGDICLYFHLLYFFSPLTPLILNWPT